MKVVFRKMNREIIALFPEFSNKGSYKTLGYAHEGQHFECDYKDVITHSYPASEYEYEPLLKELEVIYDNIRVVKKAKIVYI